MGMFIQDFFDEYRVRIDKILCNLPFSQFLGTLRFGKSVRRFFPTPKDRNAA